MAFNIRVYGILINAQDEVLLSDERRFGREFTKFPGGGLEHGEGLKDCVKREFKEELKLDVEVLDLIYLTDFYQESAFNKDDQIISVYYALASKEIDSIETSKKPFDFNGEAIESYRWKRLSELTEEDLTFPIDKVVVDLLRNKV
ncbi:MAG TPA: NUDIX domain-containing protein [Brumimicrobium sp.]|nr:NUDIX domain-containing protein [Brumimicrobium sp.]